VNALLNHRWGKSPTEDRVWAQVAGLAPSIAVRRLLMALNFQAFIDESTGPAGELVLAGHVASAEAWAHFAKEWEELLPLGTVAKNGKRHFKMAEMAMRPETIAHVPKFYEAVERNVLISISCRLNLDDYREACGEVESKIAFIFKAHVDFGLFRNPYRFLFQAFLDGFHNRRRETEMQTILPLTEKVDFIFDDRSEKTPILRGWQDYMESRDDAVKELFGTTPRLKMTKSFCHFRQQIFGHGG
jgi:hypothetical protein